MQKKLIAVAVAGVLAAPLAMAQTNVTISGTLNAGFESVSAGGSSVADALAAGTNTVPTGRQGSLTSRTRVVDNSSELRFTVTEDLGNGLKAFGTIGAAVDPGNSNVTATTASGSLGSRNTGVGLRSDKWGEIMLGFWDLQTHLVGNVDSFYGKGAAAAYSRGMLHNNGRGQRAVTQGGRMANQIRYVSPRWNGFDVTVQYSRHVEAANASSLIGTPNDEAKERTWAISPTYVNGPWTAFYGWMKISDRTITGGATGTSGILGAAGTVDVTGNRAGIAYTFPMGLRVGLIWDRLKAHETADVVATGTGSMSRTAWALPVSYTTGAHSFGVTYARAGAINASASVAAINTAVKLGDNNTGAHFWTLGYQYALSKRTNVWLNYARITNGRGAAYDFDSNAGIGMGATPLALGLARTGNEGADPRTIGIGLRHVF
ncbi:MAG: porin [Rhodocyclaceae bacterium]|nr:porin [Rhodocyclaceae bacterium]